MTRHRSIDEIITSGRKSRPQTTRGAFWPAALTAVLLWASFTPVDFGPLAWIALIPLLQLCLVPRLSGRAYLAIYMAGCLMWFPTLQWMRLGDPSMYLAWFALAIYLGGYFPAFVVLTRNATRFLNVPIWIAAPVVWVGLEFLRSHLMTGFSWYMLAHSQYRWIPIIQLSDLTGAYGVSFLIVAANAAIACLLPRDWLIKRGIVSEEHKPEFLSAGGTRRLKISGVVFATVLIASAWGYGKARVAQSGFQAGPRVGLVQGNFPISLKHNPDAQDEILAQHWNLMGMTIPYQPDVVVWPETMFPYPMFEADASIEDVDLEAISPSIPVENWRRPQARTILERATKEVRAALIIGIDTLVARRDGYDHYNSATLVTPDKGMADRYDKLHRVPFGEYIPLRDTLPFLHKLTPFGDTFGIAAGKAIHVFEYKQWRMLPLICFEDTVPHLVRSMAAASGKEKPIDVLVNLTNDGWFHGSSELDQHLITAQFRCIENRMPMVRAVNTGISAIIDGNGQVRDPESIIDLEAVLTRERQPRTTIRDPQSGKYYKQWPAAFVGVVPLDPRDSFYTRTGDWLAMLCGSLSILALLAGLARFSKPAEVTPPPETSNSPPAG